MYRTKKNRPVEYFLAVVTIAIVTTIGVGYYFRNTGEIILGDRIIGLAVLATVFILMPVFIYHRWKGKKLEDYTLTQKNIDKMRNKEKH